MTSQRTSFELPQLEPRSTIRRAPERQRGCSPEASQEQVTPAVDGTNMQSGEYLSGYSMVSSDHTFGVVVTAIATFVCIYLTLWIILIPIFEPPDSVTRYFPDASFGVAAPLVLCTVLLLAIALYIKVAVRHHADEIKDKAV